MNRIPRLSEPSSIWTAARWVVLMGTVALIAAFFVRPDDSLRLLWYALIPVLPATFLVNVELWRNVCPLSTLTMLGGGSVGTRRLEREGARLALIVGIVLLALMVPARRFLFNTDAVVLGITVLAVCLLAVAGGLLFDMKAGFCNAVCPVLPVERLYGQRPLVSVPNARCTPCTACTRVGCMDLNPERSGLLALGSTSRNWSFSGFGAFALAFPGFVLAYYLLPDGPLSQVGTVYGKVALWSAGSWVALAMIFRLLPLSTTRALVLCAGLAAGIYYWFAPPGIAESFGLSTTFIWTTRLVTLSLVGLWLVRGLDTAGSGSKQRA